MFLPGLETIRWGIALGRMGLAVDTAPFVLIEGREERIAFWSRIDSREVEPLRLA